MSKNNVNQQETASRVWPCLTDHLPGTGGSIKLRPSDFQVTELPLYTPAGTGTHIFALIEKNGLSTSEAVRLLARELECQPRDIGYAGQKDTQAVTRQWISIEHMDPDRVRQVQAPGLHVLEVTRHGNKLRLGHLQGNHFQIRMRDIPLPLPEARQRAETILAILQTRGVPNYFGPQRFGRRRDNHLLGEAILLNQRAPFIDRFLGSPHPADPPGITVARTSYKAGDYEQAAQHWPPSERDERRALRELLHTQGNKDKAFRVIDKRRKQFFVSAYQSGLFNQVLARRLPEFDRMLPGDMAMKHVNGACFTVEDAAAEQSRCLTFEISPTGPLLGPRMTALTQDAGAIENPILQDARCALEKNPRIARDLGRGGRRPLRFLPRHIDLKTGEDEHGAYLELAFELDPGCYATTLLAEIMKEAKTTKK